MIVAAHPDDETLSAGATLAELAGAVVVHVTDGAPRDRRFFAPGFTGSRSEYAAVRRLELARAMRIAGVSPDRQLQLGAVDLEAACSIEPLARALLALVAALQPGVVITHAYEGGHPDHDATAVIARAAVTLARRRGITPRLLEMAGYHAAFGELVAGQLLPNVHPIHEVSLEGERLAIKRRMLACFESQRAAIEVLGIHPERFRAAPRYDFTRPPHEGTLHYERQGWFAFDRFRQLAAGALQALAIDPVSCR